MCTLQNLQGAVKLLQSQAEEVAHSRDALAAERDALAERLELAAAEAAAAQKELRRQLDAAWQDAANKAARAADLELLLRVCILLPILHLQPGSGCHSPRSGKQHGMVGSTAGILGFHWAHTHANKL